MLADSEPSPKEFLRQWRVRQQVNEYRCGAITSEGRRCAKYANTLVGPTPLCHLHEEAVLTAAPFHEDARRLIRQLHDQLEEISDRIERETRELKTLRAKKSKAKSELEKLRKLVRERRPIAAKVRAAIISRDMHTCSYCSRTGTDKDPDGRPWHIDHDMPVCRGGSNDERNLVLACASCNVAKRDRTGDEFRSSLRDA